MGLSEEVMLNTVNVIALALALVIMCLFGYLAVRAEMQLWKKTRHIEPHRRQQQSITESKAHMR